MGKFSQRVAVLAVSFLIWQTGGPAASAQAQSTPQASASADEPRRPRLRFAPTTVLDPMIVTASKLEEPLSQVSNAVTVVTQQDITRRQTTDLFEQLREVPGFTFVQTGSRGAATSLFTRGGESDHNLILIDGVKVNRAGGSFKFNDVTTLGVGRIEVVRGPQSALYGSDAMSSVIQLLTPRGQGPARATLGFRAGNPDTFEERFSLSGGTALYGYNVAVGRVDSGGVLPVNNDYSSTTLASRFDLDPGDELQLTTTLRYIDSRFRVPTSSGDILDRQGNGLDPRATSDNRRLILGPRATYQPTPWWRHNLQLGVVYEWFTYRDPEDGSIDCRDDDAVTYNDCDGLGSLTINSEYRLSADYSSDFFLPLTLGLTPTFTIGGSIEDEHYSQKNGPSGSRNAQSFYSQLHLAWRERLFVTSGFRLDDAVTYGTHLSPRVSAALIIPGLNTKLRGGYSQGIKAASFSQNVDTAFSRGNPDLEAEESESWEIGLDQPLTLGVLDAQLNLTYFSTEYKNLIAYTFAPELTSNYINVHRVRSRGLEVGTAVGLPYGFSLRGAYTYLETEVLDNAGNDGFGSFRRGEPLVRRPKHVGSFTLNYAGERLNANFHLYVKGNVTERRGALHDGYERADLALSYLLFENRWGIRSLSLEGKANNLFDADYQDILYFSSAETTFLAGFRAEF
ncbi:MAG: TonB-dependent receptor [Desulfurellaceae bacterium]|nr:TonB-dependent receptor [Desulfurellaceae bacterium]